MKKIKTKFKGLFLIKTKNNYDKRGFLREVYMRKNFKKNFIFDYYSLSKKNTIKGLHFQMGKPQDKLIIILKGKIIDYCLDLRKNSKTFLNLFKINLSSKKGDALFVPAGFAHGYRAIDKENLVLYKNTEYRDIKSEMGIDIFDKQLSLKLNKNRLISSKKDKTNMSLGQFLELHKSL